MKISIESSVLIRQKKSGVDYFTEDLLLQTMQIMPTTEFELCYFGKEFNNPNFKALHNVKFKPIIKPSRRWFKLRFLLGFGSAFDKVAKTPDADLIFFPDFIRYPVSKGKKSLVTIHDTCFIDHPEYVPSPFRNYLAWAIKRTVKKATHVLADSEYTKKRVQHHYGIKENAVTVITPAVDHSFFKPKSSTEVQAARKKYGIKKDYLLYIGTLEPRKNVVGILRAYKQLSPELRQQYQLVLGGGKGWLDGEIQKALSSMPSESVLNLGYLERTDMPALFSGAKAFLYPSNFEGWGMQVLESMACGTPVITANNSSLPEVGGSAAIYVTAGNDAELTKAIEQLLASKSSYEARVQTGLRHAKKFTWKKSAEKLRQVFGGLNSN